LKQAAQSEGRDNNVAPLNAGLGFDERTGERDGAVVLHR
jgi:hypothetical protein